MFKIHNANVADTEVLMYLPGKNLEAIAMGEALTYKSTGLEKCAATDRPQYICRGPANEDGLYPVGAVMESTRYEVPYQAKPTVGTKVTLHTDALQVTATATNGVFLVERVDEVKGTAIGRFVWSFKDPAGGP